MVNHTEVFSGMMQRAGFGSEMTRDIIRKVTDRIVSGAARVPFRVIAILLPVLLVLVHLLVMFLMLRYDQFLIVIGLIVAYLLPPAGKETVIPLGIALGIPWWYIALAITLVDAETGLFMALNFDLAYRIPWLGGLLSRFTDKTTLFLKDHLWIEGLSVFGIMLMVMVPFLGSGGIRGSVAGKLLGLDSYLVFIAIVTGALIGCFGIALGSDALIGLLCSHGVIPPDILSICNRT
ncbi:MAG: small multi-drug export protein [Methanoregula sp.]|jgi:hypothetical protein